jgi:transposase
MAAGKKNARRRRAWLLFQDESGLSERPPFRSTWAPKGRTPMVIHPFKWTKVSVAAVLAYRWDGRRYRLFFQTKKDSYNAKTLISFLRDLRKHFPRHRGVLLWDRLQAHRSAAMNAYLKTQRSWLTAEFLPAYAPDLNPVETLWGNVKGQELANRSVEDMTEVVDDLRAGMRRVRRHKLPFSFLAHAGLSL